MHSVFLATAVLMGPNAPEPRHDVTVIYDDYRDSGILRAEWERGLDEWPLYRLRMEVEMEFRVRWVSHRDLRRTPERLPCFTINRADGPHCISTAGSGSAIRSLHRTLMDYVPKDDLYDRERRTRNYWNVPFFRGR